MSAEKLAPRVYNATLDSITDFGNDTYQFKMKLPVGEMIHFQAGQFVTVFCPNGDKVIRRAYSIASAPQHTGHIDLFIKKVQGGAVTEWFWTQNIGDTIKIQGPYGKFVLPEQPDFDPIFIAVGTGLAPFRSMSHDLLASGFERPIHLVFGTRFNDCIPYDDEFRALAERFQNFQYIPTVSRPDADWKGESGYVQTKIKKFFPEPVGKKIYICGLKAMIEEVEKVCFELGYRKEQIHYEKYD